MAERVRGLIRELAEEQAERALLERLDAIRLRQVDVADDHFLFVPSRKDYEQAFGTYGLHRTAMAPKQAARALSRRPAGSRHAAGGPGPLVDPGEVREGAGSRMAQTSAGACGLGRVASSRCAGAREKRPPDDGEAGTRGRYRSGAAGSAACW